MATWNLVDTRLGVQPIANTEAVTTTVIGGTTVSTYPHKFGTIVRAADETLGMAEFIYLKGVSSTIVGSGVSYDDSFQTALVSIALNVPRPVAIAMSANTGSRGGWYQISGIAAVAKAATVAFTTKGAAIGITSGLAVAAASGLVLDGAAVAASAVSADATVKVMINRPTGPSSD
jgi:hypothetical protein